MKRYIIEQRANKIWDILSSVYVEKVENIRFKLGIEEFELFAALGWLARDKEIFCLNIRDEIYLSNKERLDNNLHFIKL
ncbi:MAG: winged helix-turn-helix domain-containing protein [Muribaculaceae bacterium]|nr:winged helix-turn-helix domain-containing protein [Muribaculaceae bacterium]